MFKVFLYWNWQNWIFIFDKWIFDSVLSTCPIKMETEKWPKAADSPLYCICCIKLKKCDTNFLTFLFFFSGWNILFSADRSLRRLDIDNVPGIFWSYRDILVLRGEAIMQQCQRNDRTSTLDVLPILLARCCSFIDNGNYINCFAFDY